MMQTRWRKLVVLVAVGAIAAANCFGVQSAVAAHHPASSTIAQPADQRSHDHASGAHDHSGHGIDAAHTDEQGGDDASWKYCCTTMTCTSTAVLIPADIAPIHVEAMPVVMRFDDAVRTAAPGIIDPPPRLG